MQPTSLLTPAPDSWESAAAIAAKYDDLPVSGKLFNRDVRLV